MCPYREPNVRPAIDRETGAEVKPLSAADASSVMRFAARGRVASCRGPDGDDGGAHDAGRDASAGVRKRPIDSAGGV
jgi:hypothetical protein